MSAFLHALPGISNKSIDNCADPVCFTDLPPYFFGPCFYLLLILQHICVSVSFGNIRV